MVLADRGIIVVPETLLEYRRMIAGVVMRAIGEFNEAIFRKIVPQGTEEDPHMEGVPNNPMPMFCYGDEVFERMTHATMIIQTASICRSFKGFLCS